MPAGYTYLGQFIDHDLTMDRTDVMLGEDVSPADLLQGRSPRLDLDSLYGAGPGDPASAKFYEADGLHLKTGTTIAPTAPTAKAGHDLPRVARPAEGEAQGADPRPAQRREPHRRPDPPRDDPLPQPGRRQAARLGAGRRSVPTRPQAGHPALPVADPARLPAADLPTRPSLDDVFTNGRELVEPDAAPTDVPTMPIEFSVAAFRLGHSMIRDAYNWNRRFPATAGILDYMFDFSGARRRPRRRAPAAQQLDRRLAADVRLPGGRPPGARRARSGTSTTRCGSTPGSPTR